MLARHGQPPCPNQNTLQQKHQDRFYKGSESRRKVSYKHALHSQPSLLSVSLALADMIGTPADSNSP